MPPCPLVTRSTASSRDGLASSRFGPTVPDAPASASVWQLPQPALANTCLPSTAPPPPPPVRRHHRYLRRRRRLRWATVAAEACDGGDVGGDVLGVLAGDDVCRHPGEPGGGIGDGIGDLAADGVRHGALDPGVGQLLLEVGIVGIRPGGVDPVLVEGEVEVGPDDGGGPGVGERVTAAALGDEQRLAAQPVTVSLVEPDRVRAAGDDDGGEREGEACRRGDAGACAARRRVDWH